MKSFLKSVLAAALGVFVAIFLMFFLFIVLIGSMAATMGNSTSAVADNSILMLNLDNPIGERTNNNLLKGLSLTGYSKEGTLGFSDIIKSLKTAKTDDKIKCVYIKGSAPEIGYATAKEIRDAITDFKSSGKPVYAYSEAYSQKAYYIVSAASKVMLNPAGALELKGISAVINFYKGALDKLGIEAQVIRVGNYKSAVEPYINTKMSDANRTQVRQYLTGVYNTMVEGIAASRKIPVKILGSYVDTMAVRNARDAYEKNMVDGLVYKNDVLADLGKITGQESDDLHIIDMKEYAGNLVSANKSESNKIAVIYCAGDIVSGEGNDDYAGSERITQALREARNDEDVKAIVLRINSPGGSALASEVIWHEAMLAKKQKPVIASFGDVAASGGYYIGCVADSILVQPNTITGSIGIFSIIPNLQNFMAGKLGITYDTVKIGRYADLPNLQRPMTGVEKAIMQTQLNDFYAQFLNRVATGRKMTTAAVNNIGGGHVWVGTDAIKIGLADRLGNFNDAILAAARKAKQSKYQVVEYPETVSPLRALLKQGTDGVGEKILDMYLGEDARYYRQLQAIRKSTGIMAKMPVAVY